MFVYFWRRKWQPTPVSLPGKSHGERRLESMRWERARHDSMKAHYLFTTSKIYFKLLWTLFLTT